MGGVRDKKINLRMSLGDHLHDIGLDKEVLDFFPIKQTNKNDKLDLIKTENICTSKDTIDKMTR